jgi:Putative Actinobacterial Holin-X, holin superfamily III
MPNSQASGVTQVLAEIKDLTVAYAKQETVEPLRFVGRYLGLGVAGSILIGLGVILLTVAGIRALQAETGTALTGNWSWVPYLAAIVFLAVIILFVVRAISRKPKRPPREAIP